MGYYLGDTAGEKARFLAELQAAAHAAGASRIRVTSGYRSPSHNAAVGGVAHSNHTTGNAMDGYALIRGQWIPLGVALKNVAGRYGLRSGDVPGFFNGHPDPVHVDDGANVGGVHGAILPPRGGHMQGGGFSGQGRSPGINMQALQLVMSVLARNKGVPNPGYTPATVAPVQRGLMQ